MHSVFMAVLLRICQISERTPLIVTLYVLILLDADVSFPFSFETPFKSYNDFVEDWVIKKKFHFKNKLLSQLTKSFQLQPFHAAFPLNVWLELNDPLLVLAFC